MSPDSSEEYDLADPQLTARPVTRLCTLMLSEALAQGVPTVRLQVAEQDRGNVEYERDGRWKTAMQVPRPAYGALLARVLEMARVDETGVEGQIQIRHGNTRRVLQVHVEGGAEPTVTISGFAREVDE